MSEFLGIELTDEIKAAIEQTIQHAEADDLAFFFENRKDMLTGGIRPKKSNADALRRILLGHFHRGTFKSDIVDFVRLAGLNYKLLCYLSDIFIGAHLPALTSLFGKAALLLGLVVDDRPEVAAIADLLHDENAPALPSRDEAIAQLRRDLFPLLHTCAQWLEEAGTNGPLPEVSQGAQQTSEELEALRKKAGELNRQLDQIQKEKRRLQADLERSGQQAQKLENDLGKAKKAQEEAERKQRETEQKAARMEKTQDEKIAAGIQLGLSAEIHRWLRKPISLEARMGASEKDAADLLQRAGRILDQQAEIDRHSGNLRILRERLRQLEEALRRIRLARAESLHPLPELQTLARDLELEIQALRKQLGEGEPENALTTTLRASINSAQNVEQLNDLMPLLDQMQELGILSASVSTRLYQACHDKIGQFIDAYGPAIVQKGYRHPAWRLKDQLTRNQPLQLILDGHNIIFNLPVFIPYFDQDVPGPQARQRLVQAVSSLMKDAPNARAVIFFDSPEPGEDRVAPNIKVVYSGGGAEAVHRADDAIVDYIEYCCRQYSAIERILVTSDRELAARARELNTSTLRIEAFSVLLSDRV